MIIIECCPPFQPKPKLRFLWKGWHFMWLWFGFHYVGYTLNEFSKAAIDLGRQGVDSADSQGAMKP